MSSLRAFIVGAGIVGLAVARALGERGYRVRVAERSPRAVGASIRNFGMIWPIGQPAGQLYERALRSRAIWKAVLGEAKCWYKETGSLLVARHSEEMAVLEEFVRIDGRPSAGLCTPAETQMKSPAVKASGLLGSLWSEDELIIDPQEAIAVLPRWLQERYGVHFHFNTAVTCIAHPYVWSGRSRWEADIVFVCSGADFEFLYPEQFKEAPITRCKVQMLRTAPQPADWQMGASLSAGLTLIHYGAFASMPSLANLKRFFEENYSQHLQRGIHVLVSQNAAGQLTIGDTHDYGWDVDPFNYAEDARLILDYLDEFAHIPRLQLAQTWHGIYPKMTDGTTELILHPEPGVTVINGLGGAGMTLSFGLAEEVISSITT